MTTLAWQVLGMMEAVLSAGRGGDPTLGSLLANELLACTSSPCTAVALPGIDLAGAQDAGGLFAVRSGGTVPALTSGIVSFTDEDGNANGARWGVSVDLPWNQVVGVPTVLVYGSPVSTGPALQELNVGGLRYELNVYPDAGEFLDGALHAGICFTNAFELPLVAGAEPAGRLQRNSVLLENHVPTFCPPPVGSASLLGPLVSVAKALVPARLRSMFRATRVGVIGGTPLDFSTFAPVAANTAGTLVFLTGPNPDVVAGQPIGSIRVLALSGNGTPMEKVKVTLSILNNSGVPAGAVLSGDVISYTTEHNGQEGIAVFPDDGTSVSVGKAGGYRICASGELNGFTFTQACSTLFNAQNSN